METLHDLYQLYDEQCGNAHPPRTIDELREEFHSRGYRDYAADGSRFLDEIWEDGWAAGERIQWSV